ncbi:MAG: beta-glucuronidase [Ruminococcaceae bacterium]|nr:beta-glucuronidase [Oscillospiraceae bacterium]
MTRLFDEHIKRAVQSLDGAWKFATDPDNRGDSERWQRGIPNAQTVIVPSVWNTQLGLLEYEGVAWYERQFFSHGGTLRFVFGAVMTESRVYLDGEEIGYHYGGFCPFELIVRDVTSGEHRLTVRVDNSFDEQSIPQALVDWYHCGGIIRSVSVERLEGVSILSNRVEYELSDDLCELNLRVALELYNASEKEIKDTIRVSVAGADFEFESLLKAGECKEEFTNAVKITDFSLWSAENPALYDVKISTSSDDLFDRVGFRKICVSDGKILLNGSEYRIRGVNRHEDHPDFGFAFPSALMRRDIDIAVDMGCNSLRGAHYPNNPAFVDMLDERGITFWSEIPIWGVGFEESVLLDPVVIRRGEEMHREMVKHYYNHPSIIIWGMHNEILSDTVAGLEMTKKYYSLLKEIGGNRIVTYASNKALSDISFEYCDIICLNQYNGWYEGDIESWGKFIEDFRAYRSKLGFDNKPVIMSEFGGAAVYGHRNFETYRWSEEYQARLLSHCLNLFLGDPMMVGTYIWQFCDVRTSYEAGISRARGYNNKGLLNEYRNPKASFFAVKEIYRNITKQTKTF